MSAQSVRVGGKLEKLGKTLGRGGEGDVYTFAERADVAVKIYKPEKRPDREGKVRAMIGGRLFQKTSLVAFPSELVTDAAGKFLGFVMRLVGGYRPLHEVYAPKSRKIHFPNVDYRFLVRVAQNVARAVATVHESECVIGDLNHSGVLVSKDATVALIDADSFQFSAGGRSYPCLVGVPEFTPPELQGTNLSQVGRTRAHDNFGLAVAIFQLLAMGRHPYAGRYSRADLTLGEAIAQNRFAFSVARRAQTGTAPPPGSTQLDDFSPPIAAAFESAFGLNPIARPSPAEWVNLLQAFESSLRKCSKHPTHYFSGSAKTCAWCRLGHESGVEMFPSAVLHVAPVPSSGPFDVERVWAAVRAVALPTAEQILSKVGVPSVVSVPPSDALKKAKAQRTSRWVKGVVAVAAMLCGFWLLPKVALIWLGLGVYGLFCLANARVSEGPLRDAYREADSKVRSAALAYLQRIGYVELHTLRNELEGDVDAYRRMDADLGRQLANLQSTREARQKEAFLDRFLIRRATIPGIGPAKTTALASFGIESAADVKVTAVRSVPGFGDALTAKLVAWRQSHEAKFRYSQVSDPSDALADATVRNAHAAKVSSLQAKIRSGVAALQNGASRLSSASAVPDPRLLQALTDRALIERDGQNLGVQLPSPAKIEVPIPKLAPQPQRPNVPPGGAQRPQQRSVQGSGVPSCPLCGSTMRTRIAKRGQRAGKQFWGCTRYPACKGLRN